MLAWLRKIVRRNVGAAPEGPVAPPETRPPPSPRAPPTEMQQQDPAAAEPAAPDESGFEPFGRALGIVIPPERTFDPEEEVADGVLADRILAHFRANKPPPTSFPVLSLQVLNLVAQPNVDVAGLARLIARDPALSAGILSVANSAYYRGVMEVETVRDAITRLGLAELGRVAGAVSARTLFNPQIRAEQAVFAERWTALFHHAVTVAAAAASLAARNRRIRSDRAYLGGLLHDVGMSIALRSLAALVLSEELETRPDEARIDRVLDRVHAEIGGEAHQAWNLPHYLTVLAVRHHDGEIPATEEFADLHAVRLASAIDALQGPFATRAARELVQSAAALQLGPFAVRALAAELREAEVRMAAMLRD